MAATEEAMAPSKGTGNVVVDFVLFFDFFSSNKRYIVWCAIKEIIFVNYSVLLNEPLDV